MTKFNRLITILGVSGLCGWLGWLVHQGPMTAKEAGDLITPVVTLALAYTTIKGSGNDGRRDG